MNRPSQPGAAGAGRASPSQRLAAEQEYAAERVNDFETAGV